MVCYYVALFTYAIFLLVYFSIKHRIPWRMYRYFLSWSGRDVLLFFASIVFFLTFGIKGDYYGNDTYDPLLVFSFFSSVRSVFLYCSFHPFYPPLQIVAVGIPYLLFGSGPHLPFYFGVLSAMLFSTIFVDISRRFGIPYALFFATMPSILPFASMGYIILPVLGTILYFSIISLRSGNLDLALSLAVLGAYIRTSSALMALLFSVFAILRRDFRAAAKVLLLLPLLFFIMDYTEHWHSVATSRLINASPVHVATQLLRYFGISLPLIFNSYALFAIAFSLVTLISALLLNYGNGVLLKQYVLTAFLTAAAFKRSKFISRVMPLLILGNLLLIVSPVWAPLLTHVRSISELEYERAVIVSSIASKVYPEAVAYSHPLYPSFLTASPTNIVSSFEVTPEGGRCSDAVRSARIVVCDTLTRHFCSCAWNAPHIPLLDMVIFVRDDNVHSSS